MSNHGGWRLSSESIGFSVPEEPNVDGTLFVARDARYSKDGSFSVARGGLTGMTPDQARGLHVLVSVVADIEDVGLPHGLRVALVDADGGAPIEDALQKVRFDRIGHRVTWVFAPREWFRPRPGDYEVRLFKGDEMIAHCPFEIVSGPGDA